MIKIIRKSEGQTWKNQTPDKHFWAFYYFCKRMGDTLILTHNPDKTIDLTVIKNED